jgi:hypothetical protein
MEKVMAFSFGLFLAFSAGLFVVNSAGPQQYIRFTLTAIVCTGRIQALCAGVSVG